MKRRGSGVNSKSHHFSTRVRAIISIWGVEKTLDVRSALLRTNFIPSLSDSGIRKSVSYRRMLSLNIRGLYHFIRVNSQNGFRQSLLAITLYPVFWLLCLIFIHIKTDTTRFTSTSLRLLLLRLSCSCNSFCSSLAVLLYIGKVIEPHPHITRFVASNLWQPLLLLPGIVIIFHQLQFYISSWTWVHFTLVGEQ